MTVCRGRGPADPEEDSDYMDGGLAEKEPADRRGPQETRCRHSIPDGPAR